MSDYLIVGSRLLDRISKALVGFIDGNGGEVLLTSIGGGTPFSQTLLNAQTGPINGATFTYPGGTATLTVTGSNFAGAIVTFQFLDTTDSTWKAVSGVKSSFSAADTTFINGLPANTSVRCIIAGTAGAGITAILAR